MKQLLMLAVVLVLLVVMVSSVSASVPDGPEVVPDSPEIVLQNLPETGFIHISLRPGDGSSGDPA